MSDLANLSAADKTVYLSSLGADLHYFCRGKGPPVICLHAIGHGSGDYQTLAVDFGQEYTVYGLDWPGQGRTPRNGLAPHAEIYADLLVDFVRALKLRNPIVIGNSIGGAAAIKAASEHPDLFRALVLCNPGGLIKLNRSARFAINAMAAFFRAGVRGAWYYPALFDFYYRSLILPGAQNEAEKIIAVKDKIAGLLAVAWTGFARPEADLSELAQTVEIPVWFAWAKKDRFVSWGRSKHAVRKFKQHQVTFFDAGHSAFLEEPEKFAEAFRAFIDGVTPDSAQEISATRAHG